MEHITSFQNPIDSVNFLHEELQCRDDVILHCLCMCGCSPISSLTYLVPLPFTQSPYISFIFQNVFVLVTIIRVTEVEMQGLLQ
jgi:hypothetical protein